MSKNKKFLTLFITLFISINYFSITKAMNNKPAPEIITKGEKIEITDSTLQKYKKNIKEMKDKILEQKEHIYGIENIKKAIKNIEFINKPIIASNDNGTVKILDLDINTIINQLDELKIQEKKENAEYFINENSKNKLKEFLQSIKMAIKDEEKELPKYLENYKKNNINQKQITPDVINKIKNVINNYNNLIINYTKLSMLANEENVQYSSNELSKLYDILYYIEQLLSNPNTQNKNKKNSRYNILNFNELIEILKDKKIINSNNPEEYYIDITDKNELEEFLNEKKNAITKIIKIFREKDFKKYNPNNLKVPISCIGKYDLYISKKINEFKKHILNSSKTNACCDQLKFCREIKKLLFLDEKQKLKTKEFIEYFKKNNYIKNFPNKSYYIDEYDEKFITRVFVQYSNEIKKIEENHINQNLKHITVDMIKKYVRKIQNLNKDLLDYISENHIEKGKYKDKHKEELLQKCDEIEKFLCLDDFNFSDEKMIDILKNKLGYSDINQKSYCQCHISYFIKSILKQQIYKIKSLITNVRAIEYSCNQKFNNNKDKIINLIEEELNNSDIFAYFIIAYNYKFVFDKIPKTSDSQDIKEFITIFSSLLCKIYLTPEYKLDKFLLFDRINKSKNTCSFDDMKKAIDEKYEKKLEERYLFYKSIINKTIELMPILKKNIKDLSIKLKDSKDRCKKYLQRRSNLIEKNLSKINLSNDELKELKEKNFQLDNNILNNKSYFNFADALAAPIPTNFNIENNSIDEDENESENKSEYENENKIIVEDKSEIPFKKFDVAPVVKSIDENNKDEIKKDSLYNKPNLNNIKNENNNPKKELAYYINKINPNQLDESQINKLKDIIKIYEQNKNNQNKKEKSIKEENIINDYNDEQENKIEDIGEDEKNKIEIKEDDKMSKFNRMISKINIQKIKNEVNKTKQKNKKKK